ncbi:MAG: DNA repair protein RecN [Clostridia bacterium]|nr:DNA repair protein RecN [Clostridia bacterium]
MWWKVMLKTLEIENVALIDKLSIDFSSKFTVLSGETGAGKSIIIDSLGFVLGGKANKILVKQNKNFMKVVAVFNGIFSKEVKNVLDTYGIECESEVIILRRLSSDGKSEIRINGNVVTAQMLKNISSLLVDIHGQHEHQRLINSKFHLDILDGFIKDKSIFALYKNLLSRLKEVNSNILKLNISTENQERMLDLLDYQIQEIEKFDLKENEDEELEKTKFLMKNYERIFESLKGATDSLDGNNPVIDGVKKAISLLSGIAHFDESLEPFIERLESLKYEILDISQSLNAKQEECSFDEYEFEKIDQRLDKINLLKKKYGKTIGEIFDFYNKSKKEYADILNSKEELKEKLIEKNKLLKEIFEESQKISEFRKKVASDFEQKTKKELIDLGMKNAKFYVQFAEVDKDNFENKLTLNGLDDVQFMFSANPGQDMQPLSEIISGGEASRFMLALKNILAENDKIMLMVFDEIDAGISGEMGFKVACKLANISRRHQVISVSHLPQICAMADHNVCVLKEVRENNTFVTAKMLNKNDTFEEISRLSGGSQNSQVSLNHAISLKQRCDEYKNAL